MHKYDNVLTQDEVDVMKILWGSEEELHTGEIAVRLRENRTWQTNAVISILNSLYKKSFVNCEKIGKVNYYTEAISAETYKRQELRKFIKNLFEGLPQNLIKVMIEDEVISADDIKSTVNEVESTKTHV